MARLARQFICVRIQSMNDVNLELFQFEYDLTWMSFFMDARNRFYARYGGRDDSGAESHLNRESLVRLMGQVLLLHKAQRVQTSRYEPTGRATRKPGQIPTMAAMLAKRKNKCIHCHDIKVATLRDLRNRDQLKREMVFTYPTPGNLGIDVDPRRQDHVRRVKPGSPAARAGIRGGDRLVAADAQRVLTLADFSRVLERTPKTASLPVTFERAGRRKTVRLGLKPGWKRTDDPSWRESLHVVGPTCGLWGRRLSANQRRKLRLPADRLALKVTFIWGPHTKRSGIRVGDVIVKLDGLTRDMTIKQLNAHPMLNRNWGDTMSLTLRRGSRDVNVRMTFPRRPPD